MAMAGLSQSVTLSIFLTLMFATFLVIAQEVESVLEELEDIVDGADALGGGDRGLHRAKAEDGSDLAVDDIEPGSSGSSEADHTATIVGSLLMLFIVGIGLAIAFVLNMYKKRMDDQLRLEV